MNAKVKCPKEEDVSIGDIVPYSREYDSNIFRAAKVYSNTDKRGEIYELCNL